MKAIVHHALLISLTVEEIDIAALIDREVKINTVHCGVCHSDLNRTSRADAGPGGG